MNKLLKLCCGGRIRVVWIFVPFVFILCCGVIHGNVLLKTMDEELSRQMSTLEHAEETQLYFLQYAVTEEQNLNITASYGAIIEDEVKQQRYLTVDARAGRYKLDNTHEIRGGGVDFSLYMPYEVELPLEDGSDAIKSIIWKEPDRIFKKAQERFIKVTPLFV